MKTVSLALSAALAALATSPAWADISLNVLGSAASACYHSAEGRSRSVSAIAVCSQALKDDRISTDDRVATLVNRGIVLMLSDRSADAIRDFDSALAIEPGQPEAYLNKGLTYYRIGNDQEAYALANRALELRTRKPALAYYVRGLASEERGNVRAAYSDLVRARDLDPKWDEPAAQLARYHFVR